MVLLDITAKFGYRIKYQLFFEIAQNTKDIYILQAILNFLGTGIISSAAAPLPATHPLIGVRSRESERKKNI
jgi:LAGLIDADG endonuclease